MTFPDSKIPDAFVSNQQAKQNKDYRKEQALETAVQQISRQVLEGSFKFYKEMQDREHVEYIMLRLGKKGYVCHSTEIGTGKWRLRISWESSED